MVHANRSGRPRRRRWGSAVGALIAGCLVLDLLGVGVAGAKATTATVPPALPLDPVLSTAAQAHSQAMCAAGAVAASPPGAYRQETASAVYELVGSTRLLPGPKNLAARQAAATQRIWNHWKHDSHLVDPKWTAYGSGAVACPSGTLYLTAVLQQAPAMPASGLYSTPQYTTAQVTTYNALQYTSAPDADGVVQPVLLDLMEPPDARTAARPTIVEIHPGAFVGGSRTDQDADAMQWAVRGYVAVSIDYRLVNVANAGGPNVVPDAAAATLDAQQSIRWLKAHAATYGVDPTRIITVGYSAGGALSLGTAVTSTVPYTGPLSNQSPSVAAALSTGAYLTPGLPRITLNDTEPPVMMFQYALDTADNVPAAYAFETCDALRAAGNTCDEVEQPGSGHTTVLTPGGPWWTTKIGPFVWDHLGLAA